MQPRTGERITPRCRFVEREQIDVRRKLRGVDLFEPSTVGGGWSTDRDANGVVARAHFRGGDLQHEPREARRLTIERHLENRQTRAVPLEQAAQRTAPAFHILLRVGCRHSQPHRCAAPFEHCESRIERGVKGRRADGEAYCDWNRQRTDLLEQPNGRVLRAVVDRKARRGGCRRLRAGGNGREHDAQNGRAQK